MRKTEECDTPSKKSHPEMRRGRQLRRYGDAPLLGPAWRLPKPRPSHTDSDTDKRRNTVQRGAIRRARRVGVSLAWAARWSRRPDRIAPDANRHLTWAAKWPGKPIANAKASHRALPSFRKRGSGYHPMHQRAVGVIGIPSLLGVSAKTNACSAERPRA